MVEALSSGWWGDEAMLQRQRISGAVALACMTSVALATHASRRLRTRALQPWR